MKKFFYLKLSLPCRLFPIGWRTIRIFVELKKLKFENFQRVIFFEDLFSKCQTSLCSCPASDLKSIIILKESWYMVIYVSQKKKTYLIYSNSSKFFSESLIYQFFKSNIAIITQQNSRNNINSHRTNLV